MTTTTKTLLLTLAVFVAGCGGPDRPAEAAGMGPLDSVLSPQYGDPWVVAKSGGGWQFENADGAYNIQYYYVFPADGEAGRREISVDVSVEAGEPDSLAGIIYGYQNEPRSYYLFTLGGDQQVRLHHVAAGNFEERMAFGIGGVRDRATLAIREYGNEIALLVNGEEKSRFGNRDMGRGAVGIAAGHIGRFRFANFDVRIEGRQAAASRADQTLVSEHAASQTATAQPAAAWDQATTPQASLRLKPVSVVDRNAPNGPTEAFSTLIPADWQTEGGVNWSPPNGCRQGPRIEWAAHSPDKLYSVSMLPTFTWGWTQGGVAAGCVRGNFQDAEQAVRYLFDNAPGLQTKILDVSRPPELRPIADMMTKQAQAGMAMGRAMADVALIKVRANDGDVETDSYLIAISSHYETSMPDGWGGVMTSGGGQLAALIGMSTPVGKLDDYHPAIPLIMSNFRVNERWNRDVLNWWADLRRRRGEAFRAATASIAETNSDILDSMNDSFRRRQNMSDRGQAELVESVWNTETYATPDGDRSFSAMYDQAWRLDDGSYVLTNDAFYNPSRDSGMDGERLRPNR